MTDPTPPSSFKALLAAHAPRRRISRWWWALLPALVLLLLLAWWASRGPGGPRYVKREVTRGDITVTVTATGNLQPLKTVDVGSEISGTVAEVFADYNDRVRRGQVLARLDTTKLGLTLERARATLAANQAKVLQARATREEARLALGRLDEVARLSGGQLPAATELDAARAKLARAEADLAAAEAAVQDSAGQVRQGETDIAKATIRSSIDGMVLKRSVEPGQTVAASLQAPVLFSLAEDLAEMELVVAVSEADVGQVKEGQAANFTVDAYPDKPFPATIRQVRYGATNVDNVVSYQAVLAVKNPDLSLRPGMTGTADVVVARHREVLLVPNTALRFKPPEALAAAQSSAGGLLARLVPQPPAPPRPQREGRGRARVWVEDPGGGLRAVPVKIVLTDGRSSEIETDALQPGDAVVVDLQEAAR